MSGDAAGFLLLVFVLGVLVVVLRASERRARTPADAFWIVCPRGAGAVECRFVRNAGTGLWADVVSCSAFAEPCQVTCPKTCLQLVNLTLDGESEGAEASR